MPTHKMFFTQLGPSDINEVYNLLTHDHFHGIHTPSFYTISSLINLYGEICGSIRNNASLVAVSLNCPYLNRDGVYIYTFAVGQELQRKGIGSYMFISMAKMLQEMRYKKISLRVLLKNPAALQFWIKMGFTCLPMQLPDIEDEFAENFLECAL